MSRLNRCGRSHAVPFTMLAMVAGGLAALPLLLGAGDVESGPVVHEDLRARALAVGVPERPTMSDEIEHFTERASERPEESFAQERLFNAHMLAFRAYGNTAHLHRAEEAIGRMSSSGAAHQDPDVLRSRSSLALARHDFPTALASARALYEMAPGEVATYRLFDALWAVGSRDQARDLLDGSLDTLSTAYLSRRARVIDVEGFVEPARDLFRRVVENVRAYAEPAPVRAWALVELGHFELHSGDPHAAVRRYREALDVLPGSPAAIEGLASVAYGVDRDLEVARDLYRKALDNGAHRDMVPVLADIEEALGNDEVAHRLRRDFVENATRDRHTEAMHRRTLVFLLAEAPGARTMALDLAREDLAARQDPGALDALAWVLYRRGEVELAWTLAEDALSMGSAAPPALFRGGLIAEAAGDAERALELLEEALEGEVELAPHEVQAARDALDRIG